jgi:hypothetical protein
MATNPWAFQRCPPALTSPTDSLTCALHRPTSDRIPRFSKGGVIHLLSPLPKIFGRSDNPFPPTRFPPQNLFTIPDDLLDSSLPQLLFHVLYPFGRLFTECLPSQGPKMLHRMIPIHHPALLSDSKLRQTRLSRTPHPRSPPPSLPAPIPDDRHTPTSSAGRLPPPHSPAQYPMGRTSTSPSFPRPKLKATAHFHLMPAPIDPHHHSVQADPHLLLRPFPGGGNLVPPHPPLPQPFRLLPPPLRQPPSISLYQPVNRAPGNRLPG